MANNQKSKSNVQRTSSKKARTGKTNEEPLDELTQSQRQNRSGKGRAQNGSDGTGNGGRGSNH